MSEKLSIIIPVYNEINHVRSLIKQLRLKSKNRNEIIFVDGNSNDGTKEFLDKSKDVVVVNSKKSRSQVYLTYNKEKEGKFRSKYISDKRKTFSPDDERSANKKYSYKV